MESILLLFNIDENEYKRIKEDTTKFIKSYKNDTIEKETRLLFKYLDNIELDHDEYLQFGADKCNVDNFEEFCKELNIDLVENLKNIIKNDKYRNHFYSKDRKITFSCKTIGNEMHYFGITGECNRILEAYKIFTRRCKYEDMCFGVRDFI
jgi:hypothetical protein